MLRFRYELPLLAQRVQAFHDQEVSWDELRELAGPFIKTGIITIPSDRSWVESNQVTQLDSPESIDRPIIPSIVPPPVIKTVDKWEERTFHNYMIDSTDQYPPIKSQTNLNHQSSPYLSLPKVPPPKMSIQQIGEFLFQEVDRNGNGVVSQIELIKALKNHPDLAEVSFIVIYSRYYYKYSLLKH